MSTKETAVSIRQLGRELPAARPEPGGRSPVSGWQTNVYPQLVELDSALNHLVELRLNDTLVARGRLRLVETLRLSHQVDLCIIELDGSEMVVAATPHGAALLTPARLGPPPAEPAAPR